MEGIYLENISVIDNDNSMLLSKNPYIVIVRSFNDKGNATTCLDYFSFLLCT